MFDPVSPEVSSELVRTSPPPPLVPVIPAASSGLVSSLAATEEAKAFQMRGEELRDVNADPPFLL